MTQFFFNQFSSIPLKEGDDQEPNHLKPFTDASFPCPLIFHTPQIQGANNTYHQVQQQQIDRIKVNMNHLVVQGSSNLAMSMPEGGTLKQSSSCDRYNVKEEDECGSGARWMSSKMRFMKKMMNQDGIVMRKPRRNNKQLQEQRQPEESISGSNNNRTSSGNYSAVGGTVRVCSNCSTTKTPLWRSGPSGPKSLCNACGIRQRKARRAMAAAAVSGGLIPAFTSNKIRKEKKSDIDRTVPFKKRRGFAAAAGVAHRKICFDDIVIRLSKSKAFHRVFPQDEKDAAILLMALSCGLICS